nr:VWA domain-containing protein [Marinobacterium sedimentorum]
MSSARPLPVIVLADVSGSMIADDKIKAMNAALQDMIKTFADQSRLRAEIQVGLITFGGEVANAHLPLTPAHQIERMETLEAEGRTPMGHAFQLATELLEDKDLIPSRAYRPVLVLVSDGLPTDDWQEAFSQLQASDRAQKASRFAMAIGSDAAESMLKTFANDPEAPLFKADNARDIHRFFRAVTMSISAKSQSPNPNQTTQFAIPELPDDDPMDIEF